MWLSILIIFVIPHDISTQDPAVRTKSIAEVLMMSLLKGYDTKLAPFENEAANVTIFVQSVSLIDLNEPSHTAQLIVGHREAWTDPRLTWDPLAFGNITTIAVAEDDVWLPPVTMYNVVTRKSLFTANISNTIRIWSTGDVLWSMPVMVKAVCIMRVEYFPFDSQTCKLRHTSPVSSTAEIRLVVGDMPGAVFGNAEWVPFKPLRMYVTSYDEWDQTRDELVLEFSFSRNFTYYLIVSVVPYMILSLLSVAGAFKAEASTEISQISLTSLTAMAVLMEITAKNLPKSETMTISDEFMLTVLLVTTSAMIIALLLSALRRTKMDGKAPTTPSRLIYRLLLVKQIPFEETSVIHPPTEIKEHFLFKRVVRRVMMLMKPMRRFSHTDGQGNERTSVRGSTRSREVYGMLRDYARLRHGTHEKHRAKMRADWVSSEWLRIFSRLRLIFFAAFEIALVCLLIAFLHNAWTETNNSSN